MTLIQWLLVPAFALVALTLSLLVRTALGRVAAVRSGQVKPKDVVLDSDKWPDELRKLANSYQNQLELPVLYYALLALALATALIDVPLAILSWAFVAARFVHSFIHTGSNHLLHRFLAFIAGFVVLTAMWLWFALRFLAIG